jgi:hypothetical protein
MSAYVDSGQAPAVGRWQHVAATFDGTVGRIYLDGVLAGSQSFSGSVGSSNTWRIGAYGGSPTGLFDGLVDNVRIYDRALSAAEIAADTSYRVQPERTAPTVVSSAPADAAIGIGAGAAVTATFSEPMLPSSLSPSTFVLRDGAGATVPATVTYDPGTSTATLRPTSALAFSTTYTAVVPAGGARDLAGNALAADVHWSFSTEASTPPVLVVTSSPGGFGSYLGEILKNEGLNAYATIDVGLLTPSVLAPFDVVLLGETTLTASQVTALSDWVNAGGNLIAMRPDKQLAGLLGLTDADATLANAFL